MDFLFLVVEIELFLYFLHWVVAERGGRMVDWHDSSVVSYTIVITIYTLSSTQSIYTYVHLFLRYSISRQSGVELLELQQLPRPPESSHDQSLSL